MNKLQKLRIQLNFLRAYIFTCSESTIAELRKLLYGKEYIYESIHLYSISDLFLIQNGALEEMLKRVVAFGREHCLKCVLCSVKGFICEYCHRSKIIYPFDVEETMRCNICGTVSHINCYNSAIPCPKCDRKRKRQLLAALEN
jgi:pleckstrin homology domain-containing family M member 1